MATGRAASHGSGSDVSSADESHHLSVRHSNASDAAGAASSKEDLAYALRTVADALKTQTALQEQVVTKWTSTESRSKTLSTIKIPAIDGSPNTSVKVYRDWEKDIATLNILNKLTDEELALVLFTNFTGRTKQLIECLEILSLIHI